MLNFIVWVVYFYNLFVGMCIPTYMHALECHGSHVEVRGQFVMSVFFPSNCGVLESDSGHQIW